MAMANTENFKTPLVRLSYAMNLFKARAQEEGGKEKFGCTLIFPMEAAKDLHKRFIALCKDEWGEKAESDFAKGLIRSPFLKGDGPAAHNKTTGELNPGMGPDVFFVRPNANADRPPYVIWKDPNVQETEQTVYSGCYGKAVINMYCWDHAKSGRGVSIGIAGFQKLQEGERLGGSGPVDASQWAEPIEDLGEAPFATKDDGAGGLFGRQ